jgi:DNA-directed RNA polymerase subunit omega
MEKESKNLEKKANGVYENRFELVAIAARRARDLRAGKKALVPDASDKEPVIALRELLSGKLEVEIVRKSEDGHSEGR